MHVEEIMINIAISLSPPLVFFFLSFVARAQIFSNKMGFVLLLRLWGFQRIQHFESFDENFSTKSYSSSSNDKCWVHRRRGSSMPCTCARGVGGGFKFRTLVSRDECFPHGRLTIGREARHFSFPYGSKSSLLLCFRIYARSFRRSTHR